MSQASDTRRRFLQKALAGLFFLPLVRIIPVGGASVSCPQKPPKAEGIKKKLLDYAGKTAKRLKFVPNAKEGKGHKKWKAGANCGNCKFYKAHKIEPAYGKCSLAGNKYVPTCGWCKSYLLKKSKKS